jgi:hypothetical protein
MIFSSAVLCTLKERFQRAGNHAASVFRLEEWECLFCPEDGGGRFLKSRDLSTKLHSLIYQKAIIL